MRHSVLLFSLVSYWSSSCHATRSPTQFSKRIGDNVCLTNECSRDTSENPALRNLGLLPFYIPVLHIFPYLLSASNPPANHPPCWTWIPQSILGLFGSPRPSGSVRPQKIFFSDRKKKNISGSVRLRSSFYFDLISFIFDFILFPFYISLSLAFILKRKMRNKSKLY